MAPDSTSAGATRTAPSNRPAPPGPGLLSAVGGIRRHGFLAYVEELWREHGDTFRLKLGPMQLVLAIHPEAVAQANVTERRTFDKMKSYDTVRRYLTGRGLVASTGELWRRQRKLLAPLFTPKGVQAYADIMLRDAAQLAERWEGLADAGDPVAMDEEMMLVTAAIILRAMFSTEADETVVELKEAVETMVRFTAGQQMAPHPPLWVPTPRNRRYRSARRRTHAYIGAILDERRAMPAEQWPQDLLTRLMAARDEATGAAMDADLLRDETITAFFAGHETTARTLTAAWYALASNPAAADRLHAELDRVLGDREPTVDDLRELPYTLQVVKEVLRLYPPAPFYVRDAVADTTVDGYAVAAGTPLMLSPYFTHRHPDFWDEPERFDPGRWTPQREAERHRYAYHPFATGQRICIGNHFSLLESHLLLALLARRFAPTLPPGYEPQWEMNGTLGAANGFPMRIERR